MTKRIEYNPTVADEEIEVVIDLGSDVVPVDFVDQTIVILKVTNEGIIIDFYQDGELGATIARTYGEWLDATA